MVYVRTFFTIEIQICMLHCALWQAVGKFENVSVIFMLAVSFLIRLFSRLLKDQNKYGRRVSPLCENPTASLFSRSAI